MGSVAAVAALPQDLHEVDWQRLVVDTARTYRWLVHHSLAVWTSRGHRTPVQGDKGLPDLVLARGGVVLLVELKTNRGSVTREQRLWLAGAGEHGRLWRPRDWPAVQRELRTLGAAA